MRTEIKIGLIGAGFIGQVHSLVLKRIAKLDGGSARIVAVYSHDRKSAEAVAHHWPGATVASSAGAIVTDPAVDAVWVCCPTRFHREFAVAAARSGKHVFCEKPLAMSSAEAREIADAIGAAGVLSQVGLVMRFSPVFAVIRAMLAEPGVGRALALTMRDDQNFPVSGVHQSPWRNDPAITPGGALIEHSVHDFDLLTWIFGPVARITCRTRNLNGAPGIEDFGAVDFEFRSGVHGQLTSVWHNMIGRPSNRRLEVFAENLFVACEADATGSLTVQSGNGAASVIPEDEVMRRFSEILVAERPYLAPFRELFAVPYALEDATFLAALAGRCRPDPEIAAGVAAQRLVEAAYESARISRAVEIRT